MLYVLANQSTATKRRAYFQVVSVTDGVTPATSEDGGQPQISTDGGAWTNTGIGALVSIGAGRYYADLTQAAVATAGHTIETRYRSGATAECPGDSIRTVAVDLDDALAMGLTRLDVASSTRMAGSGIGAGTLTVSALQYGSGAPISAVLVSLVDVATSGVIATGTTDGNGQVVLSHSGGVLDVHASRGGWSFSIVPISLSAGQVAAVNATGSVGVAITPTADPSLCTLYLTAREASGAPAMGVVGSARVESLPTVLGGSYYLGQVISAVASAQGVLTWTVPRGATVVVAVVNCLPEKTLVVPDAASAAVSGL